MDPAYSCSTHPTLSPRSLISTEQSVVGLLVICAVTGGPAILALIWKALLIPSDTLASFDKFLGSDLDRRVDVLRRRDDSQMSEIAKRRRREELLANVNTESILPDLEEAVDRYISFESSLDI